MKLESTPAVVCAACALVAVLATAQARGDLIAYWPFDDGSGSTAIDTTGGGNDGTLVNSPTWVPGVFGTALSFNGSNQYVDCGNDASLSLTGDLTISAFVKLAADAHGRTLISKHYDSEFDLTFWHNSRLNYYNGPQWNNGNAKEFGLDFEPGTWYHVGVTREAATKTVTAYLTNLATGTEYTDSFIYNTTPPSTSDLLTIARRSRGGAHLAATIDDVRLYDKVLTEGEVRGIYPEPGTLALLGLGAVGLLARRRREP